MCVASATIRACIQHAVRVWSCTSLTLWLHIVVGVQFIGQLVSFPSTVNPQFTLPTRLSALEDIPMHLFAYRLTLHCVRKLNKAFNSLGECVWCLIRIHITVEGGLASEGGS